MTDAVSRSVLDGRSVLLIEPQALVALDMSDLLQERGAQPVHVAARLADAVTLCDAAQPDLVLVSVPGDCEASLDFIRSLLVRAVPFIILATDTADVQRYKEFADAPLLAKPVSEAALDEALRCLFRSTSAPHPI